MGETGKKGLRIEAKIPSYPKKERLTADNLAEGKPQKIDNLPKFHIFTT